MRVKQGGSLYNFMIVFGMTRPGREPTTYLQTNHYAIPMRYKKIEWA